MLFFPFFLKFTSYQKKKKSSCGFINCKKLKTFKDSYQISGFKSQQVCSMLLEIKMPVASMPR